MLKTKPFSFRWKSFTFLKDKSHYRSSHRRCFERKVFLAISENLHENTCASVSFLIKLQASVSEKRESGTFCEVSKNNFFTEHHWVTASSLTTSLWEDRTYYYKVPFSSSFISLKKILQSVKSQKKMFNAFFIQLFKLWKINTHNFQKKI